MPEGPAERGVEAIRPHARASARHAESMDGAEHRASLEPVMAGPRSRMGHLSDGVVLRQPADSVANIRGSKEQRASKSGPCLSRLAARPGQRSTPRSGSRTRGRT